MTELQASLVAIGAAIVVGVISYNKWQEWRARKSVEQAFSTTQDDVLMQDGSAPDMRQEPVLTPFEGPDVIDTAALAERERMAFPGEGGEAAAAPARRSPLDAVIDCIVPLTLDAPLRGEKVNVAFQQLHLVGGKPVRVVGLNETGEWEAVAVGGIYTALQVGVQLATRAGALSELEFSELATRLDQISDQLDASAELPEMPDTMAKARALHQQVQEFDAQLSINVRANNAPWVVTTLKPALQRQGMELRPDGRLVMPDGEGGLLVSVSTNANPADDTSQQITLLLPVALVAPDRGGFKAMTAFAKSLATRLSATVVDDEGQPLTDAVLASIAEQVVDFYRAMERAGIPAGSARAQRLFS
jgi:FtsZ-interacting cell division protein ZipA